MNNKRGVEIKTRGRSIPEYLTSSSRFRALGILDKGERPTTDILVVPRSGCPNGNTVLVTRYVFFM